MTAEILTRSLTLDVVGIDPSLNATGIATSAGETTLKQKAKDGDFRLLNIYKGVYESAKGADVVVMEDLPKNAMAAGTTGTVQGVTRLALMDLGIPYVTVPPATLKKFATDKGNALKPAMRQAWLELTGYDNADDNQVDAGFLRVIGLYMLGEIDPADERLHWAAAVDKLWPQVNAIEAAWA